jgi:hypothetical protein
MTLFRWIKTPPNEIIQYLQNGIDIWNEAFFGSLQVKSWTLGYGTYMMQTPKRLDLIHFYCPEFIAHRGLSEGPDRQNENDLEILKERSKNGEFSECDVWLINNILYLGHDGPEKEIVFDDINSRYLFLHAKNKEAFEYLLHKSNYEAIDLNIFWHKDDDYVLTNHGDIIVYPGKELIQNSVFMMPENSNIEIKANKFKCNYICSDWKY